MLRLYDTTRDAYRRVRGLPVPSLVLRGHTSAITSVVFLPDAKQVLSGSRDSSIRIWRVEDGEQVGTVMEGGPVYAVAVSSDGQWIATAWEKTINIWNATTHEKVVEMKGHTSWVASLAFSPDSARVASGSDDKTVIVWSTTTGERLVGPLEGHNYAVWRVQFSPDGDRIASCDMGDLRTWHSHIGNLVIPPIRVHAESLGWTPNGQQLIVGCHKYIKSFDASTGSPLAKWKGHTNYVNSIAVSRNGSFFASGSGDTTVRLWDTATRQQIGPTLQHDSYVHSVAISPDDRHLASVGYNEKVRIWSLKHIVPEFLFENTPTSAVRVCSIPNSINSWVLPTSQQM
ncbi:WD40 repeat-like protein [Paxillus ammoniavirescens]|nr:WD40 repeat-like protein [Paxillus ammoniavirescens]